MSLALNMTHTLSLPTRTARPAAQTEGSASLAGCLNSTEILRGQKAVEINHNGSTYRLQATRLGKLILTK